ncbi:MarR family transcriptional regulator [Lentibacillus sp. L22]|uniref:MarR family winged helix-turn-helix transcriptional regulator n=1 Tax=Lentibacillus TaxID=175304 RepID=UPI0022B215AB|nr:MarR family transcriptional regulator [Lentibacillus daqui]
MNSNMNRDLFHLLNQRYRYIAKEMNNLLREYGLYASQWSIIYCLEKFGSMTQTEIWKYLNVEAPTVTRTITRLENNGWIIRTQGNDKRERVIALTSDAKDKFATIHQKMDRLEESMLASFTSEEKADLQQLLLKINATGEELD